MSHRLLFSRSSISTNLPPSARNLAAFALALVSSSSFIACGPSVVASTDNTGGAGGSDAGVGAGTTGSSSSSSGSPMAEVQTLVPIDLGAQSLNVFHGFDVPEHALGITAIVEAPGLNDIIGISRLRAPSGDYVTYDFSVMGKANYAFVKQGWVGGASVQSDLPQAWPVQAGSWRYLLGSDGPLDPSNVRIWIRRTVDGAFHGGVIDVNVFVVPNGAPQNYLDFVVGNLFSDFASLTLGNVAYMQLASTFSTIDTYDQYRALLAASTPAKSTPALNIFVINKFGTDFPQAIGVAGGIPGSATIHGTTISGVAYQPSGDPKYDVSVLRHEIGHLAGLFHTTELATEDTDPISDTVECATATIQSTPEKCPDVVNTMFPVAFGNMELTPAQVRVIQGSALYRGVWEAGGAPDPASNAVAPQQSYKPEGSSFAFEVSDKPLPTRPTALERVLGAVWCGVGKNDYEALAIRVAGASGVDVLRSIALDPTRPDLLRSRALGAYARAADASERVRAIDVAEQLVRGPDVHTNLRLAALGTIEKYDLSRARKVSVVLSVTTNPFLRQEMQRILAR